VKALAKLIWGGIVLGAGKIGLVGLMTKGLGLATSIAFPGWGALLQIVLGGIGSAFGFVFDQIRKALGECLANPRVFIVIGFAFALGHWHGYDGGYSQGAGDLETYKQEALAYQKQADQTADAARAAKNAAEKAEAAKIAAEHAKAEADKKVASTAADLEAAKAAAKRQRSSRSRRVVSSRTKSSSNDLLPWLTDLFGT